jgi:hypothetical protein
VAAIVLGPRRNRGGYDPLEMKSFGIASRNAPFQAAVGSLSACKRLRRQVVHPKSTSGIY